MLDRFLLITMFAFSGFVQAGNANSCSTALKNGTLHPGSEYLHVVRVDGSTAWGTTVYDFWQVLKKLDHSPKTIEKDWMPFSTGSIFTFLKGANTFSNGDARFEVTFTLKEGFGFLDIRRNNGMQIFKDWLKTEARRPNLFSKDHVQLLKRDGHPWHSAFYADKKLAGFAIEMGYDIGKAPFSNFEFTIINAWAIKKMEIVSVDIRERIPSDEIPEDFRARRRVFYF